MKLDVKRLFSAQGRNSRKRFWLTVLAILGVYIALGVVSMAAGDNNELLLVIAVIFIVPLIACAVIGINNNTKRLHDIGRSGWWQLLPFLPSLLGAVAQGSHSRVAVVFQLLMDLLVLVFWITVGSIPGQRQDNKFGPPPPETPKLEPQLA